MIQINDNFHLNDEFLLTSRTCVTAQSGAGKSYLIGVICEELLKNDIPFCIIDLEGEYKSLKQKYNKILWAGGEDSDLNLKDIDKTKLAKEAIKGGFSFILDISETENPLNIVEEVCQALFDEETKERKPFLLIIEEADKFIPQKGQKLKSIETIARRGRKRGLGLLIATQRPAYIDKDVLSQCNNQIIGKLTLKNDLDAVSFFFENTKELKELMQTENGYFHYMGDFVKERILIKSRERITKHEGYTPSIKEKQTTSIREIIKGLKNTEKKEAERILPRITEEEAEQKIKLKKQFLIGKETETIESTKLKHDTIIKAEIKELEKNKTVTKTLLFTTESVPVIYEKTLIEKREYEKLTKLSDDEIRALFLILDKESITSKELSQELDYSQTTARNILKLLRDKRIITETGKKENANEYKSLLLIEKPELKKLNTQLPEGMPEVQEEKIDETGIRNFVKGINENAEITETKTIYYPYYEILIKGKGYERKEQIDAVTGEIL